MHQTRKGSTQRKYEGNTNLLHNIKAYCTHWQAQLLEVPCKNQVIIKFDSHKLTDMLKVYCTGCQIWFILISWYASSSLKINWAIWLSDLRGVYSFHIKSKYYYLPRSQTFLLAHSFGLIPKLKVSPKPQKPIQIPLDSTKTNQVCIYIAIWSLSSSVIYC